MWPHKRYANISLIRPRIQGLRCPGYFKKPLSAKRQRRFPPLKWLLYPFLAVFRVSLSAPADCGRLAGRAGLHGSLPDRHQAARCIPRAPHPRAHDPHRLAAAGAVGHRTRSGWNNHLFDQLHQFDQLAVGMQKAEIARTPETLGQDTGAYGQLTGRDFNPLDLLLLLRTVRFALKA